MDISITGSLTEYFKAQDESTSKRVKSSFWATDTEVSLFDLYHRWIGTPVTNTFSLEKMMMFESAKMIEVAYIKKLQDMGLCLDPQKDSLTCFNGEQVLTNGTDQYRVEMTRGGVPVSGYMDAVGISPLHGYFPLEIKTFYGEYQEREIKNGQPKTAYLKQLAVYMDYIGSSHGVLLYVERGTGAVYQFVLECVDNGIYRCNGITFSIEDIYKRWANLYNNNVLLHIEPKPEYRYKYDVSTLDWSKVNKSDISKARNGHKVIGDWQVLYSPYKDLIIERESTQLGYTLEEIAIIREKTKGYSAKK